MVRDSLSETKRACESFTRTRTILIVLKQSKVPCDTCGEEENNRGERGIMNILEKQLFLTIKLAQARHRECTRKHVLQIDQDSFTARISFSNKIAVMAPAQKMSEVSFVVVLSLFENLM